MPAYCYPPVCLIIVIFDHPRDTERHFEKHAVIVMGFSSS